MEFPHLPRDRTYTVYKIVDDIGLQYIGVTSQHIRHRLKQHKYDKDNRRSNCSSGKLNLDCCQILPIEQNVSINDKKDREKYWINSPVCVNDRKLNGKSKELRRQYYLKNKEKILESSKKRYKQNKAKQFKSKSGIKYITYDKVNFRWRYQAPIEKKGVYRQRTFFIKRDAIVAKFCYSLLDKIR